MISQVLLMLQIDSFPLHLMQDQQYKVGCSLVRQSQADLVEDDAQPPPAIARQRQPPQTQVLAC